MMVIHTFACDDVTVPHPKVRIFHVHDTIVEEDKQFNEDIFIKYYKENWHHKHSMNRQC